jgi:hypothetical protein
LLNDWGDFHFMQKKGLNQLVIRYTNAASLHAPQCNSLVRWDPRFIYTSNDYSQERDNSLG